jgi:hypothetical protein
LPSTKPKHKAEDYTASAAVASPAGGDAAGFIGATPPLGPKYGGRYEGEGVEVQTQAYSPAPNQYTEYQRPVEQQGLANAELYGDGRREMSEVE